MCITYKKVSTYMKRTSISNEQFAEAWEESRQQVTTVSEHEQFRQEARSLLKQVNRHRRSRWHRPAMTVVGIAAMFCLVFGGIRLWNALNEPPVSRLVVSTGIGERRKVLLPDSTHVWLNACSRLHYPSRFTGKNRQVELQGEAFFQVKRNEAQPFVAIAGEMQVRVLGTAFDVKAYDTDRRSSVMVESGRVQVEMPGDIVCLSANEQLCLNKESGAVEKRNDTSDVAAWRSKRLRFDKTPLYDVTKELERIYGCRIYLERGASFESFISGSHDNESLEAVLQSLQQAAGITYRLKDENVYLYGEKRRK